MKIELNLNPTETAALRKVLEGEKSCKLVVLLGDRRTGLDIEVGSIIARIILQVPALVNGDS
jgi:hypothetical protein